MTDSSSHSYLVIGRHAWNRRVFEQDIQHYPGTWHYASTPEEFTAQRVDSLNPRYIFVLHWSQKVPDEIVDRYECIVFHMTDVPYGRGGSPLQNLIIRGHRTTKLTAMRMSQEFDAGPIYLKADLSLEGSTAEEVLIRATELSARMIRTIIESPPSPLPQIGEPTVFKRRKPEQGNLSGAKSLQEVFDYIRMLDANGYPAAFLEYNGFRYEFHRASFYEGRVVADVTITSIQHEET